MGRKNLTLSQAPRGAGVVGPEPHLENHCRRLPGLPERAGDDLIQAEPGKLSHWDSGILDLREELDLTLEWGRGAEVKMNGSRGTRMSSHQGETTGRFVEKSVGSSGLVGAQPGVW